MPLACGLGHSYVHEISRQTVDMHYITVAKTRVCVLFGGMEVQWIRHSHVHTQDSYWTEGLELSSRHGLHCLHQDLQSTVKGL